MRILFNKKIYPKTAIIKAAYMFTDRAYVHLDADEVNYWAEIEMKPGYTDISELEFENEVLCQTARYEVSKKTRNIREMMIARAISSTMLINESAEDEDPYKYDDVTDTKDILTDWFDRYDNNNVQ